MSCLKTTLIHFPTGHLDFLCKYYFGQICYVDLKAVLYKHLFIFKKINYISNRNTVTTLCLYVELEAWIPLLSHKLSTMALWD